MILPRARRTSPLAVLASLSVVAVSSAALSVPSSAASGDRDRDGMPNRWEVRHGLDPNHADGDRDRDRDGLRNVREYDKGADPRDEDTDGDGHDDGDEVADGSRETRVLDRDSDGDGTIDGDDDSDGDDVSDEDEDDAAESCRRDDDDRDGDDVADEDERELGGRVGDSDSDDDGVDDGDEDDDLDGESDEDEDDSEDDECDDSDEDVDDLLGAIVSFDEVTGELVVLANASESTVTFVVTEDTKIEFDSSGHGSGDDASVDDLVEGHDVAEVDLEDDDDPTANELEEIELAR